MQWMRMVVLRRTAMVMLRAEGGRVASAAPPLPPRGIPVVHGGDSALAAFGR
jgi:hypothetical protein